jgi:hypothetical protein
VIRTAATAHLARRLEDVRLDALGAPDSVRYAEGALMAYERLEVLAADELARWRGRFADPEAADATSREWAERARPTAERHLERLLEASDDDLAEAYGAIEALRACGVLDAEALRAWGERLERADASFGGGGGGGGYSSASDADLDAPGAEDEMTQTVRRVITGSTERRDDLAMVALVVHGAGTALHFHYVGPERDLDDDDDAWYDAWDELLDDLNPPKLRDDTGRAYEPAHEMPDTSGGSSGAVTGSWLYTPAAGDDARTFTVERDGHVWTLGG